MKTLRSSLCQNLLERILARKKLESQEHPQRRRLKVSKWASSRVGCYVSCPLKYKLNYLEKWQPDQLPPTSELQTKGLAFHETAEQYEEGMSREAIFKVLDEKIAKYNVNLEKYPMKPAIEKF